MDIYVRHDVSKVDFVLSSSVALVENAALCFQMPLKNCKMHSTWLIRNVDIAV